MCWEALISAGNKPFLFFFFTISIKFTVGSSLLLHELIQWKRDQAPLLELCLQVRTFRGHTNEKNFVGLTVNSEYIACGSETNEVFVYHKVSNIESAWKSFFSMHIYVNLVTNKRSNCPICRKSPGPWLGINLVLPIRMMLMMRWRLTSLVLYAGRVIAPPC